MNITVIYAALLALLFVFLSFRTIGKRRKLSIGIGDSENSEMLRAMRVHSNFAEYVPLSLILLYFTESSGASSTMMYTLCTGLLIGRCVHAFGVSQEAENLKFRVTGMVLTFTVILSCSVYLLFTNLIA